MDKKYKVGYTAGVFDLFHIGHLNILKKAKEQCEYLIVAVSTDQLVQSYKNKTPVIPFEERKAIIEALKCVDEVVTQVNRDKIAAYNKYKFDVMFVGDDWQGNEVFEEVAAYMHKHRACVEYFPYTKNVSSTLLAEVLNKIYTSA
ncbi:MAG: tagD 1 [Firmicutes bacterium]|nr:tagD 1 [Bacillota bacterium]